jgi:hypothetical protein
MRNGISPHGRSPAFVFAASRPEEVGNDQLFEFAPKVN